MKKIVLFICFCISSNLFSQDTVSHKVKVEIALNAFMCPNLLMKINRTLIQRKNEISGWKIKPDYSTAEFLTSNALLCNKDSIIKIFVKESEYPFHIIQSIQIDDSEVYNKLDSK